MRAPMRHPMCRAIRSVILVMSLDAATLLVAGCTVRLPVRAAPVSCPQPETRELIAVPQPRDDELHVRFELPDAPLLWRQPVSDQALERYRAAVLGRIGGRYDTKLVLEGARQRPGPAPSANRLREIANSRLVASGEVGTVTPMGCVELLAWREQARRFPMLEYPTEFAAFVLRRQGRVRIYFSGNNRVGGRIRREVTSLVRRDVAAGFVLEAHLHNHPFMFDRKVGDRMWTSVETQTDIGGEVAPSLTDVHFYRNALADTGLREIWVTNGFETVRIPSADLGKLHGHP